MGRQSTHNKPLIGGKETAFFLDFPEIIRESAYNGWNGNGGRNDTGVNLDDSLSSFLYRPSQRLKIYGGRYEEIYSKDWETWGDTWRYTEKYGKIWSQGRRKTNKEQCEDVEGSREILRHSRLLRDMESSMDEFGKVGRWASEHGMSQLAWNFAWFCALSSLLTFNISIFVLDSKIQANHWITTHTLPSSFPQTEWCRETWKHRVSQSNSFEQTHDIVPS